MLFDYMYRCTWCSAATKGKIKRGQAPFCIQKPLNGANSDSKWLAWATLILPCRRPWLLSEYKEAIFDFMWHTVHKKWLPVPTKSPWTGSHFWETVAPSSQPLTFSLGCNSWISHWNDFNFFLCVFSFIRMVLTTHKVMMISSMDRSSNS